MPPIVIACGDHSGIGPEVALKAVSAERRVAGQPGFVLVGDLSELERLRATLELDVPWTPYHPPVSYAPNDTLAANDPAETVSPIQVLDGMATRQFSGSDRSAHGDPALHALQFLRRAAEGCLRHEFSALVTAPVSKETILRAGVKFVGQTEYLADLSGHGDVTMMLLGDDEKGRWLRVGLVTTHLPLRDVAAAITTPAVVRAIRHASDACRRLGLPRARIGVAGLNPHAGEGGLLGDEEGRFIVPGIAFARASGHDVVGPVPADTLFHQAVRGDYDAVVAMYHDQGLAPLKLMAFDRGVNWSLGLPFIRTSPDHGTAFDIAGRGVADASSMRAAIRLASALAKK